MAGKVDDRARTWAFVMYPESMPDDWREQLQAMHCKVLVSPLHDKDVNPDGTPKKPHYHVLLIFAGKKAFSTVKKLTDALHAPRPERVHDTAGYARYLVHKDNPEKAQYDAADVLAFGGADYLDVSQGGRVDVDGLLGEMMDFCDENGVFSFAALARYARANRPDWFRVLSAKRTTFLVSYLRSAKWEADEELRARAEMRAADEGEEADADEPEG